MEFEISIIKFLQSFQCVALDRVFYTISLFGSTLGALFTVIILAMYSRRMTIMFACTYFGAKIVNSGVLKPLFNRPRPFEANPFEVMSIGGDSTGASMPSGHALSAGIIAGFLLFALILFAKNRTQRVWGSVGICTYLILVCVSRMYLGQHYLTDVLVGALLGIGITFLVFFIDLTLMKRKLKAFAEQMMQEKHKK